MSRESNNGGSGEQGDKKGKETKATPKTELMKRMTSIRERTLTNARETSSLSACCYQTFPLEPESSLAKCERGGGQLNNDAAKEAKEKDDEAKKTMLQSLAQAKGVTEMNKETLQIYRAEKLAIKENFEDCVSDVSFCRAKKAKKENQKVKFVPADEALEKMIGAALLVPKAAAKKQGQAPRDLLEKTVEKAR